MASCLQKIPSGNEFVCGGRNDEMGIPNSRDRSRLNDTTDLYISIEKYNTGE